MTDITAGDAPAAESAPLSSQEAAFLDLYADDLKADAPDAPESSPPSPDAPVAPDVVDPEDAGDPDENKGKFVRHGAFHAERERRKALEAKLAERDTEFTRLNERMAVFNDLLSKTQAPAAEAPPAPPSIETDPIGYMKWLGEELEKGRRATEEAQQRAQASQQLQQVVTTYQQDAVSFARETPDFGDAYTHLIQGRDRELSLYGIADPKQRAQIIQQEEQQLVANALQAGKRPAQMVYEMAQARGYAKAAPAPAPQPPAADDVRKIAEAQAANRSLSSMSGSAGKTELTVQDLISMSDAEFASVSDAVKRRLMGG